MTLLFTNAFDLHEEDKSNWFRQLPWDERLKNAYDQGMAILLHNVDPDYTSSEIE
nr:protein anti-silencing 1 [Tanacetum cinerariifolium]